MTRRAGILVLLGILAGCMPAPQQPGAEIIDLTMAGRPSGVRGQGARQAPAPAAAPAAPVADPAGQDAGPVPAAGNASTVAALASVAPSDPVRDYSAARVDNAKGGAPAQPDGGLVRTSAAAPAADVAFVNSRRIQLNYEVEDVGPSGLASVDLWYTCDGGPWRKYPAAPQKPPFAVDVDREGRYGFLLLAHNGAGQGKAQPDDGDKPQITVEVDQTPPALRLGAPQYDAQAHALVLLWEASDRNLGSQPIALLWAREPGGPWLPIITQRANTGRHVWKLPPGLPRRIWVRAEASDLAGNVAVTDLPEPLLLPEGAVPTDTAVRQPLLPSGAGQPVPVLPQPQVSGVQITTPPAATAPESPQPSRPVLSLEPIND